MTLNPTRSLLHGVARLFRALPYVPGKLRVGRVLNDVLIHQFEEGVVQFRTRQGAEMRIDLRSKAEWRAYWTGRYDDDEIRLLLKLIDRRGTVLDVGAQVGFYTVGFARGLNDGIVHSFEPVGANFARLTENVRSNSLQNVKLYNIALGNKHSASEFRVEKKGVASTGNAFEVRGDVKQIDQESEEVQFKKLDAIAEEVPIEECSLVKVDIEGGEVGFLRGGTHFLQKERPYIYGEFNAFWLNKYGQSFNDVLEMCEQWGYNIFKVGDDGFERVLSPGRGTENVLLVPEEKAEYVSTVG